MPENDVIRLINKIGDDLETIKRLLRIQGRPAASNLLDEIATTTERQQMWRLADGTLSNEQISEKVGVALRSVQYFMQEAENVGLIFMAKRGYPRRVEDIIPSHWKSAKKSKNINKIESNIRGKKSEQVLDPLSGDGTE